MAQLSSSPPPPTLSYAIPALAVGRPAPNLLALWVGIAIFAAMSLWMAIASKGFLEADALTHYMFARHAMQEPHYLTDVWGRPLCTGMYVLPAAIAGRIGVRVMSLLLAIATGLISYRIAQRQNYRLPALAAILLFIQPLFFLHSFSELTEIPFAFVMILAFWAYQSRHFAAMALLAAITPTGRPEGLFLMVMAACALIAHRRAQYLFILPLPLLLWSYLGWLSWGSPGDLPWYRWLQHNWPWAPRSAYGSGQWYKFIIELPVLLSPLVFPAFIVGVIWSIRTGLSGLLKWRPAFLCDHRARCQLMIAVIPLTILFVHSVLWTLGLMASNGELRYLLCVAPLWGLLCAKGWEWAWERFRLPAPFLCAAVAATTPIYANWYYQVLPLRIYESDLMGLAAANWYKQTPGLRADYPRVMSSPPSIYYFLDVSQSDRRYGAQWGRENVETKPPGTILFWDQTYGLTNASRALIVPKEDVEADGWIWIGNIVYGGEWCNVYLSPQTAAGKPTDPNRYRAPGDTTPDR